MTLARTDELPQRGCDTRIICTATQASKSDVLNLLDSTDELDVSLVKFHVFSTIGVGHGNLDLTMYTSRMGRVLRSPEPGRTEVPDARLVPADVRPPRPDGALPG